MPKSATPRRPPPRRRSPRRHEAAATRAWPPRVTARGVGAGSSRAARHSSSRSRRPRSPPSRRHRRGAHARRGRGRRPQHAGRLGQHVPAPPHRGPAALAGSGPTGTWLLTRNSGPTGNDFHVAVALGRQRLRPRASRRCAEPTSTPAHPRAARSCTASTSTGAAAAHGSSPCGSSSTAGNRRAPTAGALPCDLPAAVRVRGAPRRRRDLVYRLGGSRLRTTTIGRTFAMC